MTYAAETTVSAEKSRGEIERTLTRYGADSFAYGWSGDEAMVGFQFDGRQVRFVLAMPDRNAREFTHHKRGARTTAAAYEAWEKACRQRWRALALVVKAKLEAVEGGISTFETEFLGHILLPNGQTMGEWARPQVEQAYSSGTMPAMLPALGTGSSS
jgi:hypothetical protein